MEIFLPIVLLIIFCILFSICGWCCKRRKAGIVYGQAPPVTITSTHVSTTPNIPPYPSGPQHPIPQPVQAPTGIGFAHQTAPYPTGQPPMQPGAYHHYPSYHPLYPAAPYGFSQPGQSIVTMGSPPYPPVGVAPYPPAHPAPGQLPPPYHEVVGQSGPTQPYNPNIVKEGYSKQAPYNPNY